MICLSSTKPRVLAGCVGGDGSIDRKVTYGVAPQLKSRMAAVGDSFQRARVRARYASEVGWKPLTLYWQHMTCTYHGIATLMFLSMSARSWQYTYADRATSSTPLSQRWMYRPSFTSSRPLHRLQHRPHHRLHHRPLHRLQYRPVHRLRRLDEFSATLKPHRGIQRVLLGAVSSAPAVA